MHLAQEIRGVQCRGIEMARGQSWNAEVSQPDGKILRGGSGVVGQKNEWRSGLNERRDEFLRAREQLILSVHDPVHID